MEARALSDRGGGGEVGPRLGHGFQDARHGWPPAKEAAKEAGDGVLRSLACMLPETRR